MPIARSLDAYRQSRGNLVVVVVVDSSQPEFPLLFETTFGALFHFGIPFRVADLARGRLHDDVLNGCRAALVAQEHLGGRLGEGGQATLLRALDEGMGLVSFDADLAGYGAEWLRAAGLAGAAAARSSRAAPRPSPCARRITRSRGGRTASAARF